MALLAECPVSYVISRDPAPTYEGGPDGRRATFAVQVAIGDVTAFVQHAIHSVETIDYGGGVTAERVVPLVYPDDPGMHLVGYRVEYFGTPGEGSGSAFADQFSRARIHCDFGVLPFGVGGDQPFYTLSTDHGVEMEALPGSTLVFPSGKTLTGDWALRVGTVAYNLTTYLGTTTVSPTISNMAGKVNVAAVDFPGIGTFAAGHLRLDGIRSEYAHGMFSRTMTKSFSLRYREREWNAVMNVAGVWEVPTLGTTGLTKYESADFEILKYA